jgi:hypothetical protein
VAGPGDIVPSGQAGVNYRQLVQGKISEEIEPSEGT